MKATLYEVELPSGRKMIVRKLAENPPQTAVATGYILRTGKPRITVWLHGNGYRGTMGIMLARRIDP